MYYKTPLGSQQHPKKCCCDEVRKKLDEIIEKLDTLMEICNEHI